MLRITLASLHLLALSIGMMATVLRGSALREAITIGSLRRAVRMDAIWGIAAVLWIVTGLWRLLGATEKPTDYYFENTWFVVKMGFFTAIILLEIWPMIVMTRWRSLMRGGASPTDFVSSAQGRRMAMIGHIQATLGLGMIVAAVAMARGYG